MCQHFSGHTVRQFYAVIHNQRVTNNHCWNVDDAGYKKPRYILIVPDYGECLTPIFD